jgi:hypothetical protein
MAGGPNREFGKRKAVAIPSGQPVKRSGHVALLLMGTFAVGGGAYALIPVPGEHCESNRPGIAAPSSAECQPRGASSGGAYGSSGGSSTRATFYGGDSSSSRSAASTNAGSGGTTRGGFGSFARAFASHFSVAG